MIEMNAAKCLGRRHIKFGLVLGNSVVLSIHRILFRQELVVCDGIHPRLGISSSNLLFKMYITYSVLSEKLAERKRYSRSSSKERKSILVLRSADRLFMANSTADKNSSNLSESSPERFSLKREYILHICGGQRLYSYQSEGYHTAVLEIFPS